MMAEKDLKKQGRGAIGYRVKTNSNITAVKWYNNKAVTLISSFVGIDPIAEISRLTVVLLKTLLSISQILENAEHMKKV